MTHPSRRLFLLSASALGGTLLPGLSSTSSAQVVLNTDGLFPGLSGTFSDQVDYDINPTVTSERAWDAVLHYAGSNTALLAPKVADFEPAEPPLPHITTLSALEEEGHVYRIDRERSNATGKFQVEGQSDGFLEKGINTPDGFIAIIPSGKYELTNATYQITRNRGYNYGARIVFRGEISEDGAHPELTIAKGTLAISEHRKTDKQTVFAAFEAENLEINSPATGLNGGPGVFLRYYRYENVLFSGGFKNANFLANWPTIGIYNNCVFARGGRGDGLTHSFYGGYVQTVVAHNCLFTSPNKEGHPLKVYATQIELRGCTIANWWHENDMEEGYYGDQTPLDIGAWTQTVISDCHFFRRGNSRRTRNNPFIDIRNRVYEKGTSKYQVVDFGTDGVEFDYRDVDNKVGTPLASDPAPPLLFRHLIVNNKFYNGILPDKSTDLFIEDKPGYLIRNNGANYNWAHGKGALESSDLQYRSTPTDYGVTNERCVVYTYGNTTFGVPVIESFPGPYGHASDPSPIVPLPDTFPAWSEARLASGANGTQWWATDWPSEEEFHPPPPTSED